METWHLFLYKGAMLSVCAKEGIKIQPNALDAIINGAHQDIRQTLHNLYTWTASKKTLSYDEAKANAALAEKDSIKMGPFEACRAMFQPHSGKRPGSLVEEKMDLYFEDYSFVPLFVQQNYLNVNSYTAKNVYEELDLISKTADSLSLSDLVDRDIRSKQAWSLLPIHVRYSYHSQRNLQTDKIHWYCPPTMFWTLTFSVNKMGYFRVRKFPKKKIPKKKFFFKFF